MIVEDVANIGEDTHIWIGDKLLFEGKYTKDNLYSNRTIYGAGYEEEIESEPQKWYRCIELE